MSEKYGNAWVEATDGRSLIDSNQQHIWQVEEGKIENRDLGMWTESFADFLRKYQDPPTPLLFIL